MAGPAVDTFSVIGVDLAAQPKDTAYCKIVANPKCRKVEIEQLKTGKKDACDKRLLEAFSQQDVVRIGIDAPFGWPLGFVGALSEHRSHNRWPKNDPDVYTPQRSTTEYRDLKYRATDLHVWRQLEELKPKVHVRTPPFSVSADKIGAVSMRMARLHALAESRHGLVVDRSGRKGRFVEVYPAAAFARWHVEKKERIEVWPRGERFVPPDEDQKTRLKESDHAVDALAAALVVLMAHLDPKRDTLIEPIPAGMEAVAKREGWIALPTESSLEQLGAWLKPSKP